MSDTASTNGETGHNLPVLSVSELSDALRGVVEDRFAFVRVRGEISGFKRAGSGHLYFALKDTEAVLDAVCWRGVAGRLGMAPEDGMEVVVGGRLTIYPGRSRYQIVVETMELAGEGALLKLLEDRKRKLAAEGLFDPERKRPLPFLPDVIGVVTSPTGAVIRDILHRLRERFPRHVLVWPVLVQGDGAAEQVAAAIEGFNALSSGGPVPRPELLIVARGGGSLEDLWAFNEEVVVRAAAASAIPLISAVGHETDTTLIDYAADRRAPTPTAAAEIAVPVRVDLLAQVMESGTRLVGAVSRTLDDRKTRLDGLARGLPDLPRLLETATQRLDDWSERLSNALGTGLERKAARLAQMSGRIVPPRGRIENGENRLSAESRALDRAVSGVLKDRADRLERWHALLESYSYARVLDRGFALVRDAADNPVSSAASLSPGQDLALAFKDGTAGVRVTAVDGGFHSKKPAKPRKARRPDGGDGRQGELL